MITVDLSTSMPIARARPPSDMMLMVLPVSHRPTSEPSSASGMLDTTTMHAAQIAQEEQDHQAGQGGADQLLRWPRFRPRPTRWAIRRTRKSILTLSRYSWGTTSRNSSIDLRMSATTFNVEAVLFLMIGK